MNLVLLGGPVANKLTAELVTGTKSKSAGDIEVVADAYTKGKAATKAAADELAKAL